ncbi:copper amine oxidase [Domibacillus sp. DTU_2020_1001157_1_SI_ALB_TIR_016]|uniref:copper amine oxidase n=1 Tax=Domibacillus sp. DTU_2020_1001157_1_SI_ALB_TIR_016 TaxID=3077789 RepID=UPI0028E8DDAF|nr:copper amine oxidase [Domibacillus sp. DTU_2020_1001157_1_SI_ALB_TIR_016]WNS78409.1 copper amine oxidase [Domibacillus sp. DTU_2020_1001157_1_SI_ALB_TIR_016]
MKIKKQAKKLLAPAIGLTLLAPGAASASANADAAPSVETPAVELRSSLDHLLSEHYVLAITVMTKAYDGADDAAAAQKALEQNAADMEPAIASLYGKEGAAEFERIFSGHNEDTAKVAQAAKTKDAEARAAAEKDIDQFVQEFSAFLATATGGKLPSTTSEEVIRVHENQVLSVFDHYTAGDYEAANVEFREGYKHMYDVSKALSTAIVTQMPDKFDHTKADTPAADLRSTLNSLAAEHFALAATGMQKGFDRKPDYDFVSWAEDANTADFKAAISSMYGEEGAAQFEKVWQTNHINAQAELVIATLEGDDEAVNTAKGKLHTFANDFGTFLETATGKKLPAQDAAAAVKEHEGLLQQTFEEYTASNYNASYASFREGYAYMFGIGQVLGKAIVTQMPDRFTEAAVPDEMPKTGLGGTESSGMMAALWAVMGTGFGFAAAVMLRRKAVHK